MKLVSIIAGAALVLLLAGCSNGGGAEPEPKTVRITLERTVCFGFCPAYQVEIREDGSVTYTGQNFVMVEGEHRATISREAVAALVAQFEAANYFELKRDYIAEVTDLPTYSTSVTIDGRSHSIRNYGGAMAGMPAAVSEIEKAIDETADTARWVTGSVGTAAALKAENWDFASTATSDMLARAASPEAVSGLIAAGADPNRKTSEGEAPFFATRNEDAALALLAGGADVISVDGGARAAAFAQERSWARLQEAVEKARRGAR